jgi:methyl-accepting chemotaxis protein
MRNWTIRKRIILGFTVIIFMVACLGTVSALLLKSILKDADELATDSLPGAVAMNELNDVVSDGHIALLHCMFATNTEELKKYESELAALDQKGSKLLSAYEATINQAEDRHNFTQLQGLQNRNTETAKQVLALLDSGKKAEVEGHYDSTQQPAYEACMAQLDLVTKWNFGQAIKSGSDSAASARLGLKAAVIICCLVILLSIVCSGVIVRSLNKVLGRVANSLNEGSGQVASAAGQVSSASQTLAEGSSEQAASIEETSASLEEMSSMTSRNSENAQKANELARQARTAADKGASDMQSMSAAMEAIKVSSDDIAKIIKTIDEIAFQTNILALNAAVEAARAGAAGMGFAVVADEVRNLAQRSAQAAKETAAKIEGAISKTGQGVTLSGKVAETLNEIVVKARQVDELAAEVANASREQTQGITQINTAVGQMDKVTQSNAANAEESAAAAQELNAQAEIMKQTVAELLNLIGGTHSTGSPSSGVPAGKFKAAFTSSKKHQPASVREISPVKHETVGASAKVDRSAIPMDGDFKDF